MVHLREHTEDRRHMARCGFPARQVFPRGKGSCPPICAECGVQQPFPDRCCEHLRLAAFIAGKDNGGSRQDRQGFRGRAIP